MWDKRTPLQRADVLIWTGAEALYIWDRRRKERRDIPFSEGDSQNIPYVPKFHVLWEKPKHYQSELRKLVGWRKCRVLLAVPEDISFIEKIALEDFIYSALGTRLKRRGLASCSHSLTLGKPTETYIAATRTCRCYCIALVQEGKVTDSELLDAYRLDRFALDGIVRDFQDIAHDRDLRVYYPETEEDWALMGLGKNVSFAKIAAMDKPAKKAAASAGKGK